jgi:hypothetical protein
MLMMEKNCEARFRRPSFILPDVTPIEPSTRTRLERIQIRAYRALKETPVARGLLHQFGPILTVVCRRGERIDRPA